MLRPWHHFKSLSVKPVWRLWLDTDFFYRVGFWPWCSNSTASKSVINTALFKSKVVKNLNIYTGIIYMLLFEILTTQKIPEKKNIFVLLL